MTFDNSPGSHDGAELIMTMTDPGVAAGTYGFTFKVSGGSINVLEETFTIEIVDCSTDFNAITHPAGWPD